jgi:hypothetical protein
MTQEAFNALLKKYMDRWNAVTGRPPLWVVGARAGDSIAIPGVTFANNGAAMAGMELLVHAQLIVLNQEMKPESLASTFLHEYGHALHRFSKPGPVDWVESEIEAIKFPSLALST